VIAAVASGTTENDAVISSDATVAKDSDTPVLSVKQDLSRIRQSVADFTEDTTNINDESVLTSVDSGSDYGDSETSDEEENTECNNRSMTDNGENMPSTSALTDSQSEDTDTCALPSNTSSEMLSNKKRKLIKKRSRTAEGESNKRVKFAQSEAAQSAGSEVKGKTCSVS